MANTTSFGGHNTRHDDRDELSVIHMLNAFEALNLLLGEAGLGNTKLVCCRSMLIFELMGCMPVHLSFILALLQALLYC